MLVLLAIPVVVAVAFAYRVVQTVAPSNVLIAHVRASRPSVHAAAGLAALTLLLVALAHGLAIAIAKGAPAWLNLVVLILAWDAIKTGLVAVSVVIRRASSRIG